MQKHREQLKERMEKPKETDPEKYQEVMQKRKELLEKRLEDLKQNNPEKVRRDD